MTNISIITDTGMEVVLKNPIEKSIQLACDWGEHKGEIITFESETDYLSLLTGRITAVMVYEMEG